MQFICFFRGHVSLHRTIEFLRAFRARATLCTWSVCVLERIWVWLGKKNVCKMLGGAEFQYVARRPRSTWRTSSNAISSSFCSTFSDRGTGAFNSPPLETLPRFPSERSFDVMIGAPWICIWCIERVFQRATYRALQIQRTKAAPLWEYSWQRWNSPLVVLKAKDATLGHSPDSFAQSAAYINSLAPE